MKRKYTYILLVIVVTAALYFAERYVNRQNEHYPEADVEGTSTAYKEFSEQWLPTSTTGEVIHQNYFVLSYSEVHEQAEWVAYELKKNQLTNQQFDRPYFVQDRKVSAESADWRNYKNSGYDRGHLVPAADRSFDYNAFHETFLTSNISPQNREFNAGIWNRLEQNVRRWANKKNGVFVITGGVLEDGLPTIGDEEVSVPNEFYKIVIDVFEEKPKLIAFLIPNQPSGRSYFDFVVSVDEIEAKTGIDFLHHLPDALEFPLEKEISTSYWK